MQPRGELKCNLLKFYKLLTFAIDLWYNKRKNLKLRKESKNMKRLFDKEVETQCKKGSTAVRRFVKTLSESELVLVNEHVGNVEELLLNLIEKMNLTKDDIENADNEMKANCEDCAYPQYITVQVTYGTWYFHILIVDNEEEKELPKMKKFDKEMIAENVTGAIAVTRFAKELEASKSELGEEYELIRFGLFDLVANKEFMEDEHDDSIVIGDSNHLLNIFLSKDNKDWYSHIFSIDLPELDSDEDENQGFTKTFSGTCKSLLLAMQRFLFFMTETDKKKLHLEKDFETSLLALADRMQGNSEMVRMETYFWGDTTYYLDIKNYEGTWTIRLEAKSCYRGFYFTTEIRTEDQPDVFRTPEEAIEYAQTIADSQRKVIYVQEEDEVIKTCFPSDIGKYYLVDHFGNEMDFDYYDSLEVAIVNSQTIADTTGYPIFIHDAEGELQRTVEPELDMLSQYCMIENYTNRLSRIMEFDSEQEYYVGQCLKLGCHWSKPGADSEYFLTGKKYCYVFHCENLSGYEIDYDSLTERQESIFDTCEDNAGEQEVLVNKDLVFKILSIDGGFLDDEETVYQCDIEVAVAEWNDLKKFLNKEFGKENK